VPLSQIQKCERVWTLPIVLGGEVGDRITIRAAFRKHGWSITDRAKTVSPKICSKNLPVSAVTENALQWKDDHEMR
jgi:hypothetical protein